MSQYFVSVLCKLKCAGSYAQYVFWFLWTTSMPFIITFLITLYTLASCWYYQWLEIKRMKIVSHLKAWSSYQLSIKCPQK